MAALLPQVIRPSGARGAICAFASGAASGSSSGWTLTLERGIGKAYGAEAELQATGAFAAEVFPDLPIATTWQNLAKALTGRLAASASADPSPPFTHYTTRPGALKVITAAANLRSEAELEARILQAAGEGAAAAGGQRADVLLCVSGSHPVRSLPLVSRFLRSSLDTLRVAQRLKERGHIPPGTQLWVVANPNKERDAALLEAKASLGASTVLTQPPLDWPAYLAWLDDAERRGLLRPAVPAPTLRTSDSPLSTPLSSPSRSASGSPGQGGPLAALSGADPTTLASAHGTAAAAASTGPASGPPASIAGTGGVALGEMSCGNNGGGGDGRVRLFVGHPMVSSLANLSFWVTLAGCGGSAAAQGLVAAAARAEMEGGSAAAAHALAYNRRLVEQVLERGGAAGLHVMPITKSSKKMAMQMLQEGSLPRSEPAA